MPNPTLDGQTINSLYFGTSFRVRSVVGGGVLELLGLDKLWHSQIQFSAPHPFKTTIFNSPAEFAQSVTFDQSTTHTGLGTFNGGINPKGNITGVTDGSNAAAGKLGEYITSLVQAGSAVALTTAVAANITSISLTPGDWDVTGWVGITPTTTANFTNAEGSINTVSATRNANQRWSLNYGAVINTTLVINAVPTVRYSVTTTTTFFLVGFLISVGNGTGHGQISARRIR